MVKFKPCPFCGAERSIIQTAESEWNEDHEDEPYPHSNAYRFVCDATRGGCGASAGFDKTVDDAVRKWNRRWWGG